MPIDEPRARIGYRGGVMSRAKSLALKGALILGGAVTLVSAFVVSLVFVAVGLTLVLAVGGYLWWQTRALRTQIRARMQEQSDSRSGGDIIEGEVISRQPVRYGDRNGSAG